MLNAYSCELTTTVDSPALELVPHTDLRKFKYGETHSSEKPINYSISRRSFDQKFRLMFFPVFNPLNPYWTPSYVTSRHTPSFTTMTSSHPALITILFFSRTTASRDLQLLADPLHFTTLYVTIPDDPLIRPQMTLNYDTLA